MLRPNASRPTFTLVAGLALALLSFAHGATAATSCEIAYAARDYAGAAEAARRAPGSERSRDLCLGRALVRLGRPGEAVAPLAAALRDARSVEDRFAAANALGMAHAHLGDTEDAIAAHGIALDASRDLRDPHREADTLLNLALAYEDTSQPLAVGLLERSLQLSPRSSVALLTLGAIYQEQRRWEASRSLAARAVRVSRDAREDARLLTALLQYADAERHVGRHDAALTAAREAVDLAAARRDTSAQALAYEILTDVFIDRDEPGEAMIHAFAAMATRFGAGDDEAVDRIAARMKQAFEQPRP